MKNAIEKNDISEQVIILPQSCDDESLDVIAIDTLGLPDDGETVAGKIDSARDATADALEGAASALHRKAAGLPGDVTALAHRTAEGLENTAFQIRRLDGAEMLSEARDFVRSHPVPSIVAAAAVGFLVGRGLRRL